MRLQILAILFQAAFLIVLDILAYKGLAALFTAEASQHIVLPLYIFVALASYFGVIRSISFWRSSGLERGVVPNVLMGLSMNIIVTKIFFVVFLLALDIVRLIAGVAVFIRRELDWIQQVHPVLPERPFWAVAAITAVSFGILLTMGYGIIFGKYRFTLEKKVLSFPSLPDGFDGFRLVHISDAHSGSWDQIEGVKKGIELVKNQDADMIVFTGDLVNQFKDEINPFIPLFSSLEARFGKYAILGNHDYYGQPSQKADRPAYWTDFYSKYQVMGFDLLLNQHRKIEKNGSHIRLAGVENWGKGRWFPKRGDLDKTFEGISDSDFVILLSHDPTHWEEKVIPHRKHVALTLSGHTHAMQFGINLRFYKWSPIKYRYKNWMGLYKQAGQMLYVNRGFGFLGFPGRVGMWPEITVIELRREISIKTK